MATYDAVAELPLEIESLAFERLEQAVSSAFTRVTTVVRLRGAGEEGVGEDVIYSAEDQDYFQAEGTKLPLAGTHTLDSFSHLVGGLELFSRVPEMAAFYDYRIWGLESAALDLALGQVGRPLHDVLRREPRPVTFVVSMRLGDPPSAEPVRRWLELYPGLKFKLDATSAWNEQLVSELRELDCVDSVDLKGAYKGTIVDQPADPRLYRLVAEGFPDAWIEDPDLTEETDAVLEPHRDRITWDAVIHSVDDIRGLSFPPRTINVKPSRFGSVRRLLEAYDFCDEQGILPYGGGQFELGPGRGQIQYLASLFHPDAPNDVAPGGFNLSEPAPGLPTSPLPPAPAPAGFRWGEWSDR